MIILAFHYHFCFILIPHVHLMTNIPPTVPIVTDRMRRIVASPLLFFYAAVVVVSFAAFNKMTLLTVLFKPRYIPSDGSLWTA